MKKFIYITLFIFLGILVSFLIHFAIEIPVIWLLVSDYDKWGLGISWDNWFLIHKIFAILLLILGAVIGLRQGKHWWGVIYGNK